MSFGENMQKLRKKNGMSQEELAEKIVVTRQTIDDMNTNLSDVVIESSYTLEDEELIITKGKPGVKIDTDNLLNKAKEILSDTNISDDFVEIPVINKYILKKKVLTLM